MTNFKWKHLNRREAFMVMFILLTLTGYVLFTWLLLPARQEIETLNELLQSRRIKWLKYKKAAAQKEYITRQFEQLLPQFEQSASSSNPLPKVIENLQRELHLSSSTLTPRESEQIYTFTKNEIDMEMEESFENIVTFIFQLKNQSERVNLSSIRIVANEGKQSGLKTFLTLVQYVPGKESEVLKHEKK